MRKNRNGTISGTLHSIQASIRFAFSLLSTFKEPWSPEKSESFMRQGIENRIKNFLDLCDSQIFANNKNPYQSLFDHAGYTREKLASKVRCQGLEATLSELAAEGVYLDIEEFKGKKPVIRPGLHMTVDASVFDIIKGPSLTLKSSGSRGPGRTRIGIHGLSLLASNIPLMPSLSGVSTPP